MIEFYNIYFKKNYKSKINQLIVDIKKLIFLEKISMIENSDIVLDISFRNNLESDV